MSAKPTVSILMPCFNAAGYIGSAIDSVLEQSYQDFELLCVDDGSTDGTADILASYGERVRVLRHPGGANRGQTPSMNLALKEARGEFIALIDSDDLWYPKKLETQMAFFEGRPTISVVYTNGHAIDSGGRWYYDLFRPDHTEENDPNKLLMNCYISAGNSSVVIRKAALDLVGNWNESLQAQDHDMWLRLMETHRFAYIPEFLMAYRKHPNQASLNRRQWENGFVVMARARKRYPYRLHAVIIRRAVIHYRLAAYDMKNGNLIRGLGHILLSILLHPSRVIRVARERYVRMKWRLKKVGAAAIREAIMP